MSSSPSATSATPSKQAPSKPAPSNPCNLEHTLVLVKPDGVERGLVGEVLTRIERKGYVISDMRLVTPSAALAQAHYAEHSARPFFGELVDYLCSGRVLAVVVEGERVVKGMRVLNGATDPTVASPGTIRGDLACQRDGISMYNVVHGSDSRVSAKREIALWFPEHQGSCDSGDESVLPTEEATD